LRAFSFGHVRQLEAVVGEVVRRAWALGAGPGSARLVIDVEFLTDLYGDAVEMDAFHRQHATVELDIRDLKEGAGMEHVPSGKFHANSAWLQCAVLAHNLIRWTAALGQTAPVDQRTVARTMRERLINIPGRLVNRAGTPVLRGPLNWPWRQWFERRLAALRILEPQTG
jgi:hypothetical protein